MAGEREGNTTHDAFIDWRPVRSAVNPISPLPTVNTFSTVVLFSLIWKGRREGGKGRKEGRVQWWM